jgi:zinc ribbon protein
MTSALTHQDAAIPPATSAREDRDQTSLGATGEGTGRLCANCGERNPAEYVFCRNCGRLLPRDR